MITGPCVCACPLYACVFQTLTAGCEVITCVLQGMREAVASKERLSVRWAELTDQQDFQWLIAAVDMCIWGMCVVCVVCLYLCVVHTVQKPSNDAYFSVFAFVRQVFSPKIRATFWNSFVCVCAFRITFFFLHSYLSVCFATPLIYLLTLCGGPDHRLETTEVDDCQQVQWCSKSWKAAVYLHACFSLWNSGILGKRARRI